MKTSLLLAITLVAAVTPAAAQSASDEARFRAAQERFDREYQRYRQEVDLYQSRRTGDDYREFPGARDDGRYQSQAGPGGYRAAPAIPADGYDGDEPFYDPAPDYRSGNYRERTLSSDERVYAGTDGRYYCRRSDGTTGLIVGGAAGGILGNVIDGGRSRVVGTLLGGAAGALAGRSIDQNRQIRCR
ncbi:glycine zipper 2TM domain-containing protein [Sphingomonas sp. NY01]|uniref:glycine zipper 2TM domain-containing protein n=1 Tax=Sphingomonas sp. NY01 TaxID=2968057 RepID=UPI00315DD156